jgi:hypothetical protein
MPHDYICTVTGTLLEALGSARLVAVTASVRVWPEVRFAGAV